jgi:hypothetical protein
MTSIDPAHRRSWRWLPRPRRNTAKPSGSSAKHRHSTDAVPAPARTSRPVSLRKSVSPVSLVKPAAHVSLIKLPKPVSLIKSPKPVSLIKGARPAAETGIARPDALASVPTQPPTSYPRPSDERIVALLREISELRLSAATHLTVAAAAMDAGRPDIASELIDAQQRDVAVLRSRAAELLSVEGADADEARRSVAEDAVREETSLLAVARTPERTSLLRSPRPSAVALLPRSRTPPLRSPRWSATGALLAIAATVAVALLRPLAPAPTTSRPDPQTVSASVVASLDANIVRSYEQLQVTAKPKTAQVDVDEATARLHADLQRLLPLAATDPVAAKRVLDVLKAERTLLAEHAPAALDAFAPEAARILIQLRALASPAVLALLPQPEDLVPQPARASDALERSGPRPVSNTKPVVPPVGADPPSTPPTSSAETDQPAPPAPVVVVPDPPQDPAPAPPTTGQGDSSGSTGTPPTQPDGQSAQLPEPQLPGPLGADAGAN